MPSQAFFTFDCQALDVLFTIDIKEPINHANVDFIGVIDDSVVFTNLQNESPSVSEFKFT